MSTSYLSFLTVSSSSLPRFFPPLPILSSFLPTSSDFSFSKWGKPHSVRIASHRGIARPSFPSPLPVPIPAPPCAPAPRTALPVPFKNHFSKIPPPISNKA